MGGLAARMVTAADESAPAERRTADRHQTVLQVAKLATAAGEELCILRNVSTGGLRADVYRPLSVGEPVQVELRTGREVSGRVAWATDRAIGVEFLNRVPIFTYLAHQAVTRLGRRVRAPRIVVDEPAAMVLNGHEAAVTICNASQAGMAILTDQPLRAGMHGELIVNAIGRRGVIVRWCANGQAGLQFKTPLDFAQFAVWRTRA